MLSVNAGTLTVILSYYTSVLDSARSAARVTQALGLFKAIVWRALPIIRARGGVQVVVAGKPLNFDAAGFTSGHRDIIASYHKSYVASVRHQWDSMHPHQLSAPFSDSVSLMDLVLFLFQFCKARKTQNKAPWKAKCLDMLEDLRWAFLQFLSDAHYQFCRQHMAENECIGVPIPSRKLAAREPEQSVRS